MSDDSVARAETVAAKSDPDGTAASISPPRARANSIVPVGTVVGRYVLGERIGAGGMGTVYRARDPKLDRDIAVKLVSATDVEAAQQYLEREAQAMAKLSHPNVCTVHDIGTWNGQLFIAMEMCTGGSLASWLAASRPWREVVSRFVDAGRGLAAAHRIGLVHRDFKPDNVLVHGGIVKVSDFGLVRSSTGAPSADSNPDRIEGTPAYMAPEQLEGGGVDACADQFAFAVSVWEGVCGGRPFQPEGKDYVQGMLRAIRGRRLMRSTTSKVPARVLVLLERALAADPKDRWPSLDALVDALERAARPSRTRFVAIAAGAALLAAGTTAIVMRATRPMPDVPAVERIVKLGASQLARTIGDYYMTYPHPDDDSELEHALAGYRAAFAAGEQRDLRPKLAEVFSILGRCEDALLQIEAYLQTGESTVTIAQVDVAYKIAGQKARLVDAEYVEELRAKCRAMPRTELEYAQLADAMWRTGGFDAAVVALERAYRLSDKDPMYIKRIADIRRDEGKCDEAREQYERYLSLAKDLPKDWIDHVHHAAETCKPQN